MTCVCYRRRTHSERPTDQEKGLCVDPIPQAPHGHGHSSCNSPKLEATLPQIGKYTVICSCNEIPRWAVVGVSWPHTVLREGNQTPRSPCSVISFLPSSRIYVGRGQWGKGGDEEGALGTSGSGLVLYLSLDGGYTVCSLCKKFIEMCACDM